MPNEIHAQTGSSKKTPVSSRKEKEFDYIFKLSLAPKGDDNNHWFQLIPIAFFSAVIIMITRMATYERPMDQFFWSGGQNSQVDFFSYYKMIAIILCAVLVLFLLLYRAFAQTLSVRYSFAYIPMAVYSGFVLLSFIFSDNKQFSLLGYNDRFEGTLPILGYMILLFYIINTIRTERDIKWVIYPIGVTSGLLGLLGLSQALDHDFFRTTFGKKLITPSWFWDQLDQLNFTFQNKEIYQTVYNINYVSFYLTLLIPLFGLLFIRSLQRVKEGKFWEPIIWGLLFTLLIYNLIGSASSGGILGMAAVVLLGIIVLNKRLLTWWKPVLILLCITIAVVGISYDRWYPELKSAIDGVVGSNQTTALEEEQANQPDTQNATTENKKIDYITNEDNLIKLSVQGEELQVITDYNDPLSVTVEDGAGVPLELVFTEQMPVSKINDSKYDWFRIRPAQDSTGSYNFYVIAIDGKDWPFMLTETGPQFMNDFGRTVALENVPTAIWGDNPAFGNGRGYIWSRSIPMIKHTVLLGYGADTYCLHFPQGDYVGKFNSGVFTENMNIVVDKPHNLYLGMIIGTGVVSALAFIILLLLYAVQSLRLYWKEQYSSFQAFVGSGIFLGICGFLVAATVNDSSVSTMPMFYGLLGTGIAVNFSLSSSKLESIE